MKIRNLLIGACVVAANCSADAGEILATDASGFLARGVDMYGNKNYNGAIDQLKHLKDMPASASMIEEADFYIAMSKYNNGNKSSIEILNNFLSQYPTSFHAPEILFTIGNYYFFTGKYGEAVTNYNFVSPKSLDNLSNADLNYRKAYSELRLGDYETARTDFNSVAGVPRYRNAVVFYQGYIDYVNGDYNNAMTKFQKVERDAELGYNSRYYMAQIYFSRADYAKVISMGEDLLKDNGSMDFTPEINRIVGESYYNTGNDTKATSSLERYVALCAETNQPPIRSALYLLGVMNGRNGNNENVIKYMSGVTGADDAMAQSAYLYAGQAYLKQENYNSANIAFEKAMQMSFDRSVQETAFYNYAVSQSRGSRTPFSRAIDIFEDFLNKYPDSRYQSDVEDYLINAYISGNDYNRALQSVMRIENPSPKVITAKQYVLYNLGVNDFANNDIASAKKRFTEAFALGNFKNDIYAECALWIGDCQYREGSYQLAAKNYSTFLSSANPGNINYYRGYYNLGYAQFQLKDYAAARNAFEKSVAKGSTLKSATQADAYSRIGDTYYYGKDYSAAASRYRKALYINPAIGDYALYQEAMMNGLQRQHSQKIQKIDKLISDFPTSTMVPTAMFEKAQAQLAIDDNNGALNTFEAILAKFPASSEARKGLLQLAITQKNMGKEPAAISAYKKVITKYPSSEEASLAAEDLKVIYADNNNMEELQSFLEKTPNAPRIDISELDRIAYFAAEKAFVSEKQDISKLKSYVAKYPKGAYIHNAKFYLAKYEFSKGKYDAALTGIEDVLENANDAAFAEDALVMKGAILMNKGESKDAMQVYTTLADKATTQDNRISAQMGRMRAAKELGRYSEVVTSADNLIKAGGLSSEEEKETIFNRAIAYSNLGKDKDAVKDWTNLSKDARSLYGAQSSFSLAEYYFKNGNLKESEKILNNFIDAGTPHQYWLARGFILLSDIYKKEGNKFEAKEYLESLKSNYPGKEAEIFNMIDERLKSLK